MEFNKDEAKAVQKIAADPVQAAIQEITEFELSLVGGGTGDVSLG